MIDRRTLAFAAVILAAAGPALAAAPPAHIAAAVSDPGRPEADRSRDEARKPADMLVFANVKPGARIGELMPGGGYFTRIFAQAVGPAGKVYAYLPTQLPERYQTQFTPVAAAYANVVALKQTAPQFEPPEPLDLVWTSQNYHDLHLNGGDPGLLNAAIFKALKPGGLYVVVDHAARAGSGVSDVNTLHRIDPAVVKAEVTRAGFVFDGESAVLRRSDDPHTAKVFDLHDRTDQFVYRFKKPG